jgi:Domain of unknown function (DUF4232)
MHEHHDMRRLVPTLAAALMLAACGSSSTGDARSASASAPPPHTATQPAPAKTVTLTQTAATQTAATQTEATQTTATPTASGACVASELALSFLGGQGATGHGLLGFALRNTSGHSCRTYGYPGVLFLGSNGQALPTEPTHTTQDFFGSAPLAKLVVAPGATVSFRLGVTHGSASSAGCTTAYGLQVIPPDDTATLRTTMRGGVYECGKVTVSPMQAGTSAYP